jgi:peptidyl-prolyl cis-trans isomerase C
MGRMEPASRQDPTQEQALAGGGRGNRLPALVFQPVAAPQQMRTSLRFPLQALEYKANVPRRVCSGMDHRGVREHILALFRVHERQSFPSLECWTLMQSNRFSLVSLLAGVGFLALAASPAFAQDAPSEDKTVAIVNGYEIKISEVRMAFDDVIGQLPNLPKKMRYPFVVEFLVERHLLAQLANKDGLSETDDYKHRLAAYQAKALRDTYLSQKIAPEVTEDDIKKVYDDEAKKITETERIRARHILVGSEKEAQAIEEKLKAGAKFEDLAKQYSLDGSKDYGGDLGYFTAPEMVADFSKAAFALKVGGISPPVKTEFGWHIIKLEDRKKGKPQPLDQVHEAIRNVLIRQKVQKTLEGLKDVAKVEIIDPDLKAASEEAQKQRKVIEDQQQKANVLQGGDGGDGSAGKGDLLIPDDTSNGN